MTGAEPGGRWGRWAAHPAGPALLFAFAVLEGCLFPAPTEALYAALALGRPRRAWTLAALAAAGSVVGGVIAWRMGAANFDRVGRPLLARHGLLSRVDAVSELYRRNAAVALMTSGYTPVPYLLYGVVGGASGIPLGTFVLFSAIGRGLKYAVLAGIARVAGPPLRRLLAGHPARIAAAVLAVATAAFSIWLL
ncbi:YqaA family protein [Longimicrobium terrae]|uniref:Membrane protein YqaA with SNARE-associated domain n=1 Tax=Longimicrobium terrae TaxID=1639882 RepID=A0A841GYK6_9BACT|nr:VTT domain-containing protein [Longimicrobium terrae]MBB4636644.1 membrane protein YqaA with SNARE-associated domain [Longimicrobium terrae]MBB6070832.1 membrane protein YqaA with SNARE-associated domain [Longimicrobium terrae]NNC28858.1 DedA family protein [Longimicrobium terrae]